MTAPAARPPLLLVGNLDCEHAWMRGTSGGPAQPGATRPNLSRSGRAHTAALASLMRVFAPSGGTAGDGPQAVLWTPEPVAQAQQPSVPGVASLTLASGDDAELRRLARRAARVLSWGAVDDARPGRRWRRQAPGRAAARVTRDVETVAWVRLLWRIAPVPAAVAARVNRREFANEVAESLDAALPGTRVVRTVDELAAHLRAGGADASPTGSWVVKAPLSASGRDRFVAHDAAGQPAAAVLADGPIRPRVDNLFRRFGPLLFEPWVPRVEDLAVLGLVPSGTRPPVMLGWHRQTCGEHGRFRAAHVPPADGVSPPWTARLCEVGRAVGKALRDAGYRGPYSVDAFRWRDAAGQERLHPLCEINARLTFGFVARALSERLRAAGRLAASHTLELYVAGPGTAPPGDADTPLALDAVGRPLAWWREA